MTDFVNKALFGSLAAFRAELRPVMTKPLPVKRFVVRDGAMLARRCGFLCGLNSKSFLLTAKVPRLL